MSVRTRSAWRSHLLRGAVAALLVGSLAACASEPTVVDSGALDGGSAPRPAKGGPSADAAPTAQAAAVVEPVPDAPAAIATTTTLLPATTSTTTAVAEPPAPTGPRPSMTADGLAAPLSRPWAERFPVAHAEHATLAVHESPGGPVARTFTDPTAEGMPLIFLVRSQSADGQWLHVQLPTRPNGAMAWVRRDEVTVTTVPTHVVVHRSDNRITVYRGEMQVLDLLASVGAPESPTPIGTFYVDGLHQVLRNPDGVYGPFQISFTGFSTVYTRFAGGIGQVAFHGTNRPDLIGTPASHGCVRLSNADIIRLSRLLPIGTPVEVVV